MFDPKLLNHEFNLFFFLFTSIGFLLIWYNIARPQQIEKAKSIFWFSVSLAISLIGSCWFMCFQGYKPYAWWIVFPMLTISLLNSLAVLLAIENFFPIPAQPYKKINLALIIVIGVVFVTTIYQISSNKLDIENTKSDLKNHQVKIASIWNIIQNDTLGQITIKAEAAYNNGNTSSTHVDSIIIDTKRFKEAQGKANQFAADTRFLDFVTSAIVDIAFLIFFLFFFPPDLKENRLFFAFGITFIAIDIYSQYLNWKLDKSDEQGTTLALMLKNATEVVVFLIVLLAWAMKGRGSIKEDGMPQTASDSPLSDHSQTALFTGQTAGLDPIPANKHQSNYEEEAFIYPKDYEKYRHKIEKMRKSETDMQLLAYLCTGKGKSQFDNDHKHKGYGQQRQEAIAAKLGIKNSPENLAIFAVKYGIVKRSELEISRIE